MTGRELSRAHTLDGFTDVVVAWSATNSGTLRVPTDMLDQPGYQDMLDAFAAHHNGLVAIREGQAGS